MFIRETRKYAYFSYDVLGRHLSSGLSSITCPEFELRLQNVTMLKVFMSVEHAFTQVDLLKHEGGAAL